MRERIAVPPFTLNNARHVSVEASSKVLTFLIADIRGYTSYTRARGDDAACDGADAGTADGAALKQEPRRCGRMVSSQVFGSSPDVNAGASL